MRVLQMTKKKRKSCSFLFFLDGSILSALEGSHLDCVLKGHPALGPAMHLLPQNTLVSGSEDIPGLEPSPTGRWMNVVVCMGVMSMFCISCFGQDKH